MTTFAALPKKELEKIAKTLLGDQIVDFVAKTDAAISEFNAGASALLGQLTDRIDQISARVAAAERTAKTSADVVNLTAAEFNKTKEQVTKTLQAAQALENRCARTLDMGETAVREAKAASASVEPKKAALEDFAREEKKRIYSALENAIASINEKRDCAVKDIDSKSKSESVSLGATLKECNGVLNAVRDIRAEISATTAKLNADMVTLSNKFDGFSQAIEAMSNEQNK
jgi:ABC-type transporter Mla subunit MlaD